MGLIFKNIYICTQFVFFSNCNKDLDLKLYFMKELLICTFHFFSRLHSPFKTHCYLFTQQSLIYLLDCLELLFLATMCGGVQSRVYILWWKTYSTHSLVPLFWELFNCSNVLIKYTVSRVLLGDPLPPTSLIFIIIENKRGGVFFGCFYA